MRAYQRWAALLLPLLFALAPRPAECRQDPAPAIKKVITMLDNLIAELEQEGVNDEAKFNAYMTWSAKELEDTSIEIERLNTKIEELEAALSSLRTTKLELTDALKKLNGEISNTQSQINFANEKRSAEKAAFQAEQQEFAAAISACGKAVKLLAAHYGDGSTKELVKPDFVSLVETVQKAGKQLRHPKARRAMELLQARVSKGRGNLRQPETFERYEAKTGEALGIVDQIKLLKDSFVEDKQSAVEDEARLQKQYNALMKEKTELLNSLVTERDAQQKRLDETNQEIAENEGELERAERALTDAQNYVATITKQRSEFEEMYKVRKEDREAETKACRQAVGVLDEYRSAFIQRRSALSKVGGRDPPACVACQRAAALLRRGAAAVHSTPLQAAAAETEGGEAMDEILEALDGLVDRLKEDQQREKEHKEWCEKETGLTTAKRDDHSGVVEDIKNILANLGEVLVEKKDSLVRNDKDITTEDNNFDEMTKLRDDEKGEYEHDREEHVQAIQALNEAIDILAKFYASRKKAALVQLRAGGRALGREPEGGAAVKMISEVRHEFEVSKDHLDKEEDEAVALYNSNKGVHVKVDGDLHDEENTLTVEKQTTEDAIDQNLSDKKENEDEVVTAQKYLDRLGKSCFPLLANYDDRKKLRKEEEKSLKDAIKVLKTVE